MDGQSNTMLLRTLYLDTLSQSGNLPHNQQSWATIKIINFQLVQKTKSNTLNIIGYLISLGT